MVAVCTVSVRPASAAATTMPPTSYSEQVTPGMPEPMNGNSVNPVVAAIVSSHGPLIDVLKLPWAQSCVICIREHHFDQDRLAGVRHQAVRAGAPGR
eukprot:5177218-Pyramimonas_sp.AAC.1